MNGGSRKPHLRAQRSSNCFHGYVLIDARRYAERCSVVCVFMPVLFCKGGHFHFCTMITIRQCLEIMHAGEVFSLKVVSYDRRRKDKTGRIQEYPEAQLVWGDGGSDRVRPPGERQMTPLEQALSTSQTEQDKRDPKHKFWYTRNIRLRQNGLETEVIKKVHPPLIIEFNGQITCP